MLIAALCYTFQRSAFSGSIISRCHYQPSRRLYAAPLPSFSSPRNAILRPEYNIWVNFPTALPTQLYPEWHFSRYDAIRAAFPSWPPACETMNGRAKYARYKHVSPAYCTLWLWGSFRAAFIFDWACFLFVTHIGFDRGRYETAFSFYRSYYATSPPHCISFNSYSRFHHSRTFFYHCYFPSHQPKILMLRVSSLLSMPLLGAHGSMLTKYFQERVSPRLLSFIGFSMTPYWYECFLWLLRHSIAVIYWYFDTSPLCSHFYLLTHLYEFHIADRMHTPPTAAIDIISSAVDSSSSRCNSHFPAPAPGTARRHAFTSLLCMIFRSATLPIMTIYLIFLNIEMLAYTYIRAKSRYFLYKMLPSFYIASITISVAHTALRDKKSTATVLPTFLSRMKW